LKSEKKNCNWTTGWRWTAVQRLIGPNCYRLVPACLVIYVVLLIYIYTNKCLCARARLCECAAWPLGSIKITPGRPARFVNPWAVGRVIPIMRCEIFVLKSCGIVRVLVLLFWYHSRYIVTLKTEDGSSCRAGCGRCVKPRCRVHRSVWIIVYDTIRRRT